MVPDYTSNTSKWRSFKVSLNFLFLLISKYQEKLNKFFKTTLSKGTLENAKFHKWRSRCLYGSSEFCFELIMKNFIKSRRCWCIHTWLFSSRLRSIKHLKFLVWQKFHLDSNFTLFISIFTWSHLTLSPLDWLLVCLTLCMPQSSQCNNDTMILRHAWRICQYESSSSLIYL